MKINTQAIIEITSDQIDHYILELENYHIIVHQYTVNDKRQIVTSLTKHKDYLELIFKHMQIVDIYTAMVNHADEIIMKEI